MDRSSAFARVCLFLTVLTPVILIPHFFFPFVTTRNLVFRVNVELALAALIYRGMSLAAIRRSGDNILGALTAFVVAISVSAVVGVSPWRSLFGDFERMGGVWAWLHLLLFYFLLRVTFTPRDWKIFFRAALVVSDMVVLWGGATILPASLRNPAFVMGLGSGSTIGNSGLLGGYLLLCIGFACYLLVSEKQRGPLLFAAASLALAFVGMQASLSRSAAIGFVAGCLAGVAIFAVARKNRAVTRRAIAGAAVSLGLIAGVTYAVYLRRAPSSEFEQRWLSALQWYGPNEARPLEWKIALEGFADRPILGYGVENHEVVASAHFDPRLYAVGAGTGVFDRPHNAWVELLGTTGLLGTAAMLGLWCAVFLTLRNAARRRQMSNAEVAVWGGVSVAYAVYLFFWFFDLNAAMLWVAMLAFIKSRERGLIGATAAAPSRSRLMIGSIEALLALSIYFHGIVPLWAAHEMAVAVEPGGSPELHLAAFLRVMDSAAPQTLQTFPLYRRFVTGLTLASTSAGMSQMRFRQLDLAFRRGFYESKLCISRDPRNDREYLEDARLFFLARYFYGDTTFAREADTRARRAIRLSPMRAENRVFLFSVLLSLGDTAGALAQLDTARRNAPAYGPPYFFSGKLAIGRGEVDAARTLLMQALLRGYAGSGDVYLSAQHSLEQQGRFSESALLGKSYLDQKFGQINGWVRLSPQRRPHPQSYDAEIAGHLPIAFLKAGRPDSALVAAKAFGSAVPAAAQGVAAFVGDLGTGRGYLWLGRESVAPLMPAR